MRDRSELRNSLPDLISRRETHDANDLSEWSVLVPCASKAGHLLCSMPIRPWGVHRRKRSFRLIDGDTVSIRVLLSVSALDLGRQRALRGRGQRPSEQS